MDELRISGYNAIKWRWFIDYSMSNMKLERCPSQWIFIRLKPQLVIQFVRVMNMKTWSVDSWFFAIPHSPTAHMCVVIAMVCFLLSQQYIGITDFRICGTEELVKTFRCSRISHCILNLFYLNGVHHPLVEKNNIIFGPLHIKLGLTMQFVKPL